MKEIVESRLQLMAEAPAYDFVTARTHDGRPLKILTVVDEYSRELRDAPAAGPGRPSWTENTEAPRVPWRPAAAVGRV